MLLTIAGCLAWTQFNGDFAEKLSLRAPVCGMCHRCLKLCPLRSHQTRYGEEPMWEECLSRRMYLLCYFDKLICTLIYRVPYGTYRLARLEQYKTDSQACFSA